MLNNNRVIWDDNGTLKDLSQSLNNYHSSTSVIDFVSAEDAIYIGSDLPFNHRYFDVSVVNAAAATVSVSIWNGSEWESAVDVIDQTSNGSAPLSASGIVSWTPDRNGSGWSRESTSENVTGISTLKIYNLYWAKMTYSANLTGTLALRYVGHKFSSDEDLIAYYPELNSSSLKTAFKAGKTDWNEQHFAAAEKIIKDLRQQGHIWSRNQILNWELFTIASVHAVAGIVFRAFGDDYKDNLVQASKDYWDALNLKSFEVDKDADGRFDTYERFNNSIMLRR